MRYKTGEDRYQQILFPEVLDNYITEENPVRVIDAYINSLNLLELGFTSKPKQTGRPPYNPKDMLKLYLYGYFNKIRSSRKLETETTRNIELMWLLCKLCPDHKTISRFRKENAKALKNVFRNFVRLCQKLDLYGKELLAIDGSKFRAVNAKDNNYNHKKLENKIHRIDEKLEQYLQELNENDEAETDSKKHTKEEIAAAIKKLSERKQVYESLKTELIQTQQTQISTTDPDARRMKVANGGSEICYNIQTALDDKHKLIVDYEVTNQCTDKNLLMPLAKSSQEALGVEEISVVADKGYFVATDIAHCINNHITPHVSSEHESITFCIPVTPQPHQVQEFKPQEFSNKGKPIYIKERNLGLCPMGNILYPRSYSVGHGSAIYSNAKACRTCSGRRHCKSYYDRELKVKMRQSEFSKEYNESDLHIKQLNYTPDKKLLRRRKELVEHPFGTIKRNMDCAYCLLKGIENVRGEFALTFLAYNFKRALNILGGAKLLAFLSKLWLSFGFSLWSSRLAF